MKEQRAHSQKLMHEQAYLADAGMTSWAPVVLIDISLSGISFASPVAIINGQLRQLQFRMPGSPLLHRALVCIVHHTTSGVPVGFKVGARFEDISADTTAAIPGFLGKPEEASLSSSLNDAESGREQVISSAQLS